MYIHLGFFIFISIPCRFSCSMFFGSMLFAKKVRHSTFGADGSSQPSLFYQSALDINLLWNETNKYPTRSELDDYFPNTSLYSFVSCLVDNLRSSSYKVSFSHVTVQTSKSQLYSSCRLSSRNLLVVEAVKSQLAGTAECWIRNCLHVVQIWYSAGSKCVLSVIHRPSPPIMMMDGNGRGRDMRSALRGSREQLWRDIMHMWCTYMWLMDRVERSREGFNLAQGPIFFFDFQVWILHACWCRWAWMYTVFWNSFV